jgi:hypothetical protein
MKQGILYLKYEAPFSVPPCLYGEKMSTLYYKLPVALRIRYELLILFMHHTHSDEGLSSTHIFLLTDIALKAHCRVA